MKESQCWPRKANADSRDKSLVTFLELLGVAIHKIRSVFNDPTTLVVTSVGEQRKNVSDTRMVTRAQML